MLRRPLLLLANAAQRFLIPRTTVKHCMASVEMSAAAGEAASQASVETSADVPETSAAAPETAAKRTADEEDGPSAKKLKPEDEQEEKKEDKHGGLPFRKKKVALMLMYSGKGYTGMQKNPGVHTIEDDLLSALVKAGVVTADHASEPGKKMNYQRAARTDKGVSAAGQLCSLKMFIDVENPVEKINQHLPPQIRLLGVKKATKGFDSKNSCCGRSYIYLLPTFAFAPLEEKVTEDFRVTSEIIEKVNEILCHFEGTHNFHNFTSGKKFNDPSARRYITGFMCGQPFIQDGLELVIITVKGQSFVLHQIRKMIGLTIAIMRGFASEATIKKAWASEKVDVPRAPGLGLLLDKTHYDKYNRKFGKDGIHEPLSWEEYKEEIDNFKRDFIFKEIIETEKNEKSMMEWLATLPLHSFDIIGPDGNRHSSLMKTTYNLKRHRTEQMEKEASDVSEDSVTPANSTSSVQTDAKTDVQTDVQTDTTEAQQSSTDSGVQKNSDDISEMPVDTDGKTEDGKT